MMKKYLIIMVALIGFSFSSQAQKVKESKWSITPRVGMMLGNIKEKSHHDQLYYKYYTPSPIKNQSGVALGVECEYKFLPWMGASVGIFFTTQSKKNKQAAELLISKGGNGLKDEIRRVTNFSESYQYLDFPVLANFHVYKGLTLKTGIQIGTLLKREYSKDFLDKHYDTYNREYFSTVSQTLGGGTAVLIKVDDDAVYVEETSKENGTDKDHYKTIQLAIPIGLSYVYRNIELDARYVMGLNKMYEFKQNHSSFYDRLYRNYFMLTLGYKFEL